MSDWRLKFNMKFFLAAVLCLLAGCTRENLDDCFSGLHLKFEFTLHEYGGNKFDNHVQVVRVYLFDSDGILQQIEEGRGAILTNSYVMRMNLLPGKYTVIAWAGSHEEFSKSYREGCMDGTTISGDGDNVAIGRTTLSDFKISLHNNIAYDYPEDILPVTDEFDDLYYGAVGTRTAKTSRYQLEQVEVKSGLFTERTIELIRNTNLIHVSVTGIDYFQSPPNIWVSARNGCYHTDNTIDENARLLRYRPYYMNLNQSKMDVSIKLVRMDLQQRSSKPVYLFLEDPVSGALFPKQAIDIMAILLRARNPETNEYIYKSQEDFDRIYEHPVRIEISADLNMRVFVHNWEVVDLIPALEY